MAARRSRERAPVSLLHLGRLVVRAYAQPLLVFFLTLGIAPCVGEGASREHYTLCRCGASKNKPFCDGTHWHIGFKDP
jgi:hypothetical protein